MSRPAMMTRDNFGELLTPIHKKIFFQGYNEKPAQYVKIFKKDTMRAKQQTYPHLGAMGIWDEGHEGQVFNLKDMSEGPRATFVATRYDASYKMSWELVQDDLYGVMKGIGKGGNAKALGKGLRNREEVNCANIVLNGFSVPGYDGKPLFAADHPLIDSDKTCSNLITGPLTDANLKKACTLLRSQLDEAGMPISARPNLLVVHPDLEFVAKAIVQSQRQSGTDLNDKNTLPNLEVFVWDYLINDDGLTPWFIQDTSFENLLFLTREAPIFGDQFIPGQMDSLFYGYSRFAEGYVDWRGLVGSTGVTPAPEPEPEPEPEPVLGELTATIAAGSTSGKTKVTAVTGAGGANLKYLVDASITAPEYGDEATGYSELTLDTDISCTTGDKIIVVEVDSENLIIAASDIEDVIEGE